MTGPVADVYDDEPEVPWWGDEGYDGRLIDPGAGDAERDG